MNHLFLVFAFYSIAFVSFLVMVLYLILMFDLVFGGHDFTTSTEAIQSISGFINANKKGPGTLYDLGSCRGDLVLGILKNCPQLKAHGIDNGRVRNLFSRGRAFLLNRPAQFVLGDIFQTNVSDANIVYIYLDQSLMPSLEEKLQKELKPGSMVITNTQHLPTWPLSQTVIVHPNKPAFEKLFIYIKS